MRTDLHVAQVRDHEQRAVVLEAADATGLGDEELAHRILPSIDGAPPGLGCGTPAVGIVSSPLRAVNLSLRRRWRRFGSTIPDRGASMRTLRETRAHRSHPLL